MHEQLQNALIELTGRGTLLKRAGLALTCLEQIDDRDVPRAFVSRLEMIRATLRFHSNDTAGSRNAKARRGAFDLIDLYTACLGQPDRQKRAIKP